MLVHPQFDPIALDLHRFGIPLAVHWYGLTYLVAFGLFLFLATRRTRQPQYAATGWSRREVEDLLFYGVLGTVLGGRLGYVLFYKPDFYLAHPAEILAVWKGGMAFHGGLLGVITAMALFARSRGRTFLEVADLVAPCVPTGFAAVRMGNFINGELYGRYRTGRPAVGDDLSPRPLSRGAAPSRRRSINSCSKVCCCSCCCGCTRGSRAASARYRVSSWSATACSVSPPSSSASPTISSACSRSA